jgi:hypothetical protein
MNSPTNSPTTVDAALEYLTVDSYGWPDEPQRTKRLRLESEERKRRHRDDQKRFMLRKRARLNALREEAALKEVQLQYLSALGEEMQLLEERKRLDELHTIQQKAKRETIKKEFPVSFSLPTEEFTFSFSLPTEEVCFSLPTEEEEMSFSHPASPLPLDDMDTFEFHPELDSFLTDVILSL